MKELGILFSPPMVRAIVAGQKTVTRRAIPIDNTPITEAEARAGKHQRGIPTNAQNVRFCGPYIKCDSPEGSFTVSSRVDCPFAEVERLWVREAWCTPPGFGDWRTTDRSAIRYTSTDGAPEGWKRRHARFMPRKYSRLVLGVVGVRVERLHEIDDADAQCEGVLTLDGAAGATTPRERFEALWREINGSDSWAADPWVYRIEFKVLEGGRHV